MPRRGSRASCSSPGKSSHARPTCGIWRKWSITTERVEAGRLGLGGDARAAGPAGRSTAVPGERREVQAEAQADRPRLPGGPRPSVVPPSRGRHGPQGTGSWTASKPSAARPARCSARRRRWPWMSGSGSGRARDRLRSRHDLERCREDHRHGRDTGRAGELDPVRPARLVEAERVDDRREPAPEPGRDDRVEHRERVVARRDVVLGLADHPAQAVARHDLGGGEALGRPVRLARARRPDEDDEDGCRELDQGTAAAVNACMLGNVASGVAPATGEAPVPVAVVRGGRSRPTPARAVGRHVVVEQALGDVQDPRPAARRSARTRRRSCGGRLVASRPAGP